MHAINTLVLAVLFLILPLIFASKKCNPDDSLNECDATEACDFASSSCQCLPGFSRFKDSEPCSEVKEALSTTPPNYSSLVDNQGSGSVLAGVLISLTLVVFVVCGVYAGRKYDLIAWFRGKLHRRSQTYDEFMIGRDDDDDDPPLQ